MIQTQKQDFPNLNFIQFKHNAHVQFPATLSNKIQNAKSLIPAAKTDVVAQVCSTSPKLPTHAFWIQDASWIIFFARLCCLSLIFPMLFISSMANLSLLRQHDDVLNTVQLVYSKYYNTTIQHTLHCQFTKFSNMGIYYASCIFIVFMPVSGYILHAFTYTHTMHWNSKKLHLAASFSCFLCIILGNISAVLFLVLDVKMHTWGFFFLSLSMTLGCLQLLFILNKKNTFQVMICTAASVLTIMLCFLAFQHHSTLTGRRFYQSATLPFYVLFYETTRSHQQ